MKVSYVEGLANHNGPESCGAAREGGVEALAGGRTGRVLSREIRDLLRKQQILRALVKKIVSGKVQFFPTNSTIQSWGCVKREKVLNPGGRWGLWNCARMRLTDERGGAMGQASWRSSFLGQRSAKFLPET